MKKTNEQKLTQVPIMDVVQKCVSTILDAGDDAFTATLMDSQFAALVIPVFTDIDPVAVAKALAEDPSPFVLMLQYKDGKEPNLAVQYRPIEKTVRDFSMMQLFARMMADTFEFEQVIWNIYSTDAEAARLFEEAALLNKGGIENGH